MPTMTTANGVSPYPKLSGEKPGGQIILLPQEGESMKCETCGMGMDENPAHSDSYKGIGKHSFNSSSKSLLEEDSPVFFGSAVKALGDGKVGGFGILFTSDVDPDLQQDYFDSKTDFFLEGETKAIRPILYDHGLDKTIKSRKLGRASHEVKDVGVWVEGQLNLRDNYEKAIYKLAEDGKLGWSSGSAPHLIQREAVGKSQHIKAWPVVEWSLTPIPVEPRTQAVALKSYAADRVDMLKGVVKEEDDEARPHEFEASSDDPGVCDECGSPEDDKIHDVQPGKSLTDSDSLKGAFDQELAEQTPSIYRLDSARDNVLNDIVQASLLTDITGVPIDLRQKITDLGTEYIARWIVYAVQQAQDFVDKGGNEDNGMSCGPSGSNRFYLRSFDQENSLQSFLSIKSVGGVRPPLNEHSSMVVSATDEYVAISESFNKALGSYIERVEQKLKFRTEDSTKSGRTISAATLGKLKEAHGKLGAAVDAAKQSHGHIGDLMQLAEPKKALDLTADLVIAVAEHENAMAGVPSAV